MTENKTGVRRPVSPKKQMAERQARESLAAVAQGWGAGAPQKTQAACEGVCNVTDEPGDSPVIVRVPEEEKPAKGETLSASASPLRLRVARLRCPRSKTPTMTSCRPGKSRPESRQMNLQPTCPERKLRNRGPRSLKHPNLMRCPLPNPNRNRNLWNKVKRSL